MYAEAMDAHMVASKEKLAEVPLRTSSRGSLHEFMMNIHSEHAGERGIWLEVAVSRPKRSSDASGLDPRSRLASQRVWDVPALPKFRFQGQMKCIDSWRFHLQYSSEQQAREGPFWRLKGYSFFGGT